MKLERWMVKLIIPSVGILGLYLGGFLGVWLIAHHDGPMFLLTEWLTLACSALLFGVTAMIAVDHALGELASHVDILKIAGYWIAATISLYLLDLIIEKAFTMIVAPWAAHMVLWLSGVYVVWREEPGGIRFSWPTATEAPKDRPRS